jgi:hypothetical protein
MTLYPPIARLLAAAFCLVSLSAMAQRSYQQSSVLASGNWFRIATGAPGIYKIDIPFLSKLGLNTSNLSSASIRLFGNGGQRLPEAPNGPKYDDLFENALWVEDGGDGILNNTDYILFYAAGPHAWTADSAQKTFRHEKNIYSEQSFYYLAIGANGKRVNTQAGSPIPNITINSYDARYFYELDTVNFLSSGKQWFGEEFSSMPGKTLTRTYNVQLPSLRNEPGRFSLSAVSRSFGAQGQFNASINGQQVLQQLLPPVSNGAYDLFAQSMESSGTFSSNTPALAVQLTYVPGGFGAQGWLNWFEIHGRGSLSMNGVNQLAFRDWNSRGVGNIGRFILGDAGPQVQVWDITQPLQPVKMNTTLTGSELQFVNDCSHLHEYIAFNNSNFLQPVAISRVNNQDLHKPSIVDYVIITHPSLLAEAQRLAQYHRDRSALRVNVVTTEQVYNEFSSGSPDPVAIRDYVKMFYDRAGNDSTLRPRYLLLFGDGSYDYKDRIRNNTNLVPAYESDVSLDPLASYTSDDFFGFLDDGDDISGNGTYLLDIGIGRIPAADPASAKAIVDKIIAYTSPQALGPWRNEMTFVADDEDANLHLQDAEVITGAAKSTAPVFNLDKIYLDAFRQEGGAGGSRYPEVNQAINSKFFNGTLIWNYSGHGGFRRLAEEVVLDQEIINNINNPFRLPLFITATCDVAPYDNPLAGSIGENLLMREKTGAIALMTTTRLVFAFSNRVMNENYIRTALTRKADSTYPTLGEAVRRAKNFTYTFFGDVINNRKFTLLGDPALTIGLPEYRVTTTEINAKPVTAVPDTLKALDTYTVSGEITDALGNALPSFNGTVYPVVFDKPQLQQTKGNDPGSSVTNFSVQKNVLFRGKAKVVNGRFDFKFIVPKDINYSFGQGKIAYYADNAVRDGNGVLSNIIVGGTGTGNGDAQGPNLRAWMNDEKFVDGSITNNAPVLLVKLSDSSGINIMGTGIGHDLVAMLDNDPEQTFILNQFYEAELDNYQKGTVRYQLPVLEDGMHTLTIKAWDVFNNSSQVSISFQVIKPEHFTLSHVLNYPNPFTTNTSFWFEHNRPGEQMSVFIQVYTVSGKLVKTLRQTIFSTGNRSSEVNWDGRDDYGSKLARGVYIYRLRVKASDGKAAEKWEKMFIL